MCSLFVLLHADQHYPILIGANRDELRARPSAPPGLFVGQHRRILSPRDKLAQGTWMGVNDAGWFAGLTNVAGSRRTPAAHSRGHLSHVALDQLEFAAVPDVIAREVAVRVYNDFQLLVTDGTQVHVFRHVAGVLTLATPAQPTLVLTNEHALHELHVPGLQAVRAPHLDVHARLDALAGILRDEGQASGHRVLKRNGDYGTVSSSLVAVPRGPITGLIWRYAAGPPDATPYRNYGNLARRLLA
jgi:uncharacterized protein with NRDE domain